MEGTAIVGIPLVNKYNVKGLMHPIIITIIINYFVKEGRE